MYNNVFSAFNGFKSFFNKFGTGLNQYLHGYIIGNIVAFY